MGRNPIGSRKMAGRERTALSRARKIEREVIAQERAEARAELVLEHGEEKVEDMEHHNSLVPLSIEILNYLTGQKTTWLKIDSPKLDEDLLAHFDHLEKEFSDKWYHGHLDNDFEKAARMLLLPPPREAAQFFRELYKQFKATKGENNGNT